LKESAQPHSKLRIGLPLSLELFYLIVLVTVFLLFAWCLLSFPPFLSLVCSWLGTSQSVELGSVCLNFTGGLECVVHSNFVYRKEHSPYGELLLTNFFNLCPLKKKIIIVATTNDSKGFWRTISFILGVFVGINLYMRNASDHYVLWAYLFSIIYTQEHLACNSLELG